MLAAPSPYHIMSPFDLVVVPASKVRKRVRMSCVCVCAVLCVCDCTSVCMWLCVRMSMLVAISRYLASPVVCIVPLPVSYHTPSISYWRWQNKKRAV